MHKTVARTRTIYLRSSSPSFFFFFFPQYPPGTLEQEMDLEFSIYMKNNNIDPALTFDCKYLGHALLATLRA